MTIIDGIDPALTMWDGPLGLPRFEAVRDDSFLSAFDAAIAAHAAEIDGIAGNPEPPTFANTIVALEMAGLALARVSALFWTKAGVDTNDVIRAVEREAAPKLSRHASRVGMNAALYSRIRDLWERRAALDLTPEQLRVLERHRRGFIQAGAELAAAEQERLAAIDERLAALKATFGQNVLADEASFELVLGEGDLDGLPPDVVAALAAEAGSRGKAGSYVVTLARSSVEPFLTFSARRDLREKAFDAWIRRGEMGGETDNRAVVREILALRAEAARLLGYRHHAARMLEDTMAKTPEAVDRLARAVWEKALARAREEEAEIAALIAEEGRNHPVMPQDWRYHAEKVRERRFAFSEAEIKPYLQLDRMIEAAFAVAERLFGLTAVERPDVRGHHPEVRVFEMRDRSGTLKAVFLGDYFARASKRSGAWMSSFQSQHGLPTGSGTGRIPFIYNVCNFAKPAAGRPALISIDDARTLFHEFGHALHGMLSAVVHPSVAGTSVSRDWVELPSQLYEHWLTVPEVLERFALHHQTGEPMPKTLLDKLLAARTFNAGFDTVEFTASAIVDMALHACDDPPEDPMAFEAEVLAGIGMPQSIVMRHRSPHFSHIFSGGYSAGYYAYQWSEVLDADAFAAFREAGDPFDPQVAERLARHVYSTGGSVDPEVAYVAFRGRLPSPEAMMRKRGLIAA